MERLVLLGASNARRCLPTIVAAARTAWGSDLRLFGAIGHGRSYGMETSVLGRTLPGILGCGIWRAFEPAREGSCRAVLTDVGNDVLYEAPVERILEWVSTCVDRLESPGAMITIVGLPVERLRGLSRGRYLAFRSILFPSGRLPFEKALASVEDLDEHLRRLARDRGLRFVTPRAGWYGFDPIHIRFRSAKRAWAEILGVELFPEALSAGEALHVRLAQPERRALFGVRLDRRQPAVVLSGGTEISLY